jgi:hypothetical protein
MKNPVRTGTMIALAAASLFSAACSKKTHDAGSNKPMSTETKPASNDPKTPADKPMTGDEKTAKVHCQGINDCKGKSGCKSAANACAGQNGCKGKGYVDVASEAECETKGGSVTAKM